MLSRQVKIHITCFIVLLSTDLFELVIQICDAESLRADFVLLVGQNQPGQRFDAQPVPLALVKRKWDHGEYLSFLLKNMNLHL